MLMPFIHRHPRLRDGVIARRVERDHLLDEERAMRRELERQLLRHVAVVGDRAAFRIDLLAVNRHARPRSQRDSSDSCS